MNLRLLTYTLQTGALAIVLLILLVMTHEGCGITSVSLDPARAGEVMSSENIVANASGVSASDSLSADVSRGKLLWNENACGACHIRNMKQKATGPALGGVADRWGEYPVEDLYDWVRASQKMVQSGHPKAKEVFKEHGPAIMPNYPDLADEDVAAILVFIEASYKRT